MAIRRTLDQVRALLAADGIDVGEERRIEHATQLRCFGGIIIVNVYDSGTVLAQGRGAEMVNAMLNGAAAARPADGGGADGDGFTTTPAMCEAILAGFPKDGWTPRPKAAGWPSAPGTVPF